MAPLLLALTSLGCATARPASWASPLEVEHPLVGRIYDVARAVWLDEAALRARVQQSDFVLLGEKHDNPDHHLLQARAIRWVAEAGRAPRVVFEMIEESRQAEVDAQLAEAPRDPDALGARLDWARSGWPEWSMYRPVFAAAMDAGFPIVAAMLPRARAMAFARGTEPLPEALVERHGLGEPMPEAQRAALIAELREAHCGHLPEQMLAPMLEVQRARDALMADKLLDAGPNGAILIAGAGHVRTDRAAPWFLARHTRASILSVAFVEVGVSEDPKDYAERYGAGLLPFDVVWFTPRANDIDRCKELEEMMKRRPTHGQ